MPKSLSVDAKARIIAGGVELFRRNGFVATSVDDICQHAGVTKGAFFHHFQTKESLGLECLRQWDAQFAGMIAGAGLEKVADPYQRLLACLDLFIGLFETPGMLKSCLAGTTVQEVSETHPNLRDAANQCFINAGNRLQVLIEQAAAHRKAKLEAKSLAQLWVTTVQGSIILAKASQDDSIISRNLRQIKQFIQSQFPTR